MRPYKLVERVVPLLHQPTLAADRIETRRQRGALEFRGKNRGTFSLGVQGLEARRKGLRDGIYILADHPQRVVCRTVSLRLKIAEHAALLPVVSAQEVSSLGILKLEYTSKRISK
jgi:hypothetical protein